MVPGYPKFSAPIPTPVTSVLPNQHRPGLSSLVSLTSHQASRLHPDSATHSAPDTPALTLLSGLCSLCPRVAFLPRLLFLLQDSSRMSPPPVRLPKPPLPPPRLGPLLIALSTWYSPLTLLSASLCLSLSSPLVCEFIVGRHLAFYYLFHIRAWPTTFSVC